MIDWSKTSKEDMEIIGEIIKKAGELGVKREAIYLSMDICAAHMTCPLKLKDLLAADNVNFMHDVAGIVNHLNRETGELEDCFVPRYAAQQGGDMADDVEKLEEFGDVQERRDTIKLLTKAIQKKLPPIYEGDGTAHAKFFTPDANWTWYACEFDGEDNFFGLVDGFEKEVGYFSLSELQRVRGPLGLPIERDLHWTPKKVYNKEPFEILI